MKNSFYFWTGSSCADDAEQANDGGGEDANGKNAHTKFASRNNKNREEKIAAFTLVARGPLHLPGSMKWDGLVGLLNLLFSLLSHRVWNIRHWHSTRPHFHREAINAILQWNCLCLFCRARVRHHYPDA